MESETRQCKNCRKAFTIEAEDFAFYTKIQVPPPTWCPECRFMRRAAWRNERKLFRAKSAKSGKDIISLYTSDDPVVLYTDEEWWTDDWDASEYAREYDPGRPFFEQILDLMRAIPRPARGGNIAMVNKRLLRECRVSEELLPRIQRESQ